MSSDVICQLNVSAVCAIKHSNFTKTKKDGDGGRDVCVCEPTMCVRVCVCVHVCVCVLPMCV